MNAEFSIHPSSFFIQPSLMPDQPQKPQSISEISHLFLSIVREKQTGAAPRPVRVPPPSQRNSAESAAGSGQSSQGEYQPAPSGNLHMQESIDLTPEEYAQVSGQAENESRPSNESAVSIPPVTAVIAQHLNGRASERVRDYARHLAANGERIGLLEVEAGELRLMCFERSIEPNTADPRPAQATEQFDARAINEALEEMSWDLDRWLLVLPNLRSQEARALLKDVKHWALLSTCDHDGVVSCYRTLKGLADLPRAHMTLALMEAPSEGVAAKVFKKLQSVCLQFLGIELEAEPAVRPTSAVAEHVVTHWRATPDKASTSDGTQWKMVAELLARANKDDAKEDRELRIADSELKEPEMAGEKVHAEFTVRNPEPVVEEREMPVSAAEIKREAMTMPELPSPQSAIRPSQSAMSDDSSSEVLDLAADIADEQSVLAAIFNGAAGELIECPVRAPMCPAARLAVTRDRGLVLLAVAGKGLTELRAIAGAYRWLVENRALIGMALPQMAIDGLRHPRLRLLVDHADAGAATLAPMLESNTVSVQAYRKLRWGGRTGLLLEAA
jgi:hypothetical protein